MSRSSAGTYTLPLPPVVPGETVDAAWANETLDDIAQALSDSLDRYGRGGMLAPFKFIDGSVGAPGIAFTNEPTSGLYREAAGVVSLSLQGTQAAKFSAAGLTLKEVFVTQAPSSGSSLVSRDGVTTMLTPYQLSATAWNTGNFNPATKQDVATAWNTSNFNPVTKQDAATAWNTSNLSPSDIVRASAGSNTLAGYLIVGNNGNSARNNTGYRTTPGGYDIGKAPGMARGQLVTDGSGHASISFPFNIPSPVITLTAVDSNNIALAQVTGFNASGFTMVANAWTGAGWGTGAIAFHWCAIDASAFPG